MIQLLNVLFFTILTLVQATDLKYMSTNETCVKCNCLYSSSKQEDLILNCSNQRLNLIPADWPSHKRRLTVSFAGNPLANGVLPQLGKTNATEVSLGFSYCKLKQIQNAAFIDIDNLKSLDLSWNLLPGEAVHSDVFRGPYRNDAYEPLMVTYLDLSYNEIHSLSRLSLMHLPYLEILKLRGNPLKIIDTPTAMAIGSRNCLQILDLSSTGLSYLPDDTVSNLKNLSTLLLIDNNLATVPEEISRLGKNLRRLDISENPIQILDDESFLGLEKLVQLNVSGMPLLRKIQPGTFAHVKQLKELRIQNNPTLIDIEPGAFGQLENQTIKELYLNGNHLRNIFPNLIAWDKLEHLDLMSNPWDCNCVLDKIMKSIPPKVLGPNIPTCFSPDTIIGRPINQIQVCTKEEFVDEVLMEQLFGDEIEQLDTQKRIISFVQKPSRTTTVIWQTSLCLVVISVIALFGLFVTKYSQFRKRSFEGTVNFSPIRYTIPTVQ